ncbi:hypothetical protein D9M68_406610 [compost metagenome]
MLAEEALDAPGVGADHLPEHRQRGVAAGGGERVTAGEGVFPGVHDGALPLPVQARRRRLQHLLPGLLQGLHEQRLADAVPFRAEAGGDQAAVGLGIAQVDALAREHGLRQGLGHRLRIGGVAHLLQLQTDPRHPGEEGLQAEAVGTFGGQRALAQ